MSDQDMLNVARAYAAANVSVIPILHGSKRPTIEGWQEMRLTESDLPNYFNGRPSNIGILTGEPSGGLVDVDLDCTEAVEAAGFYLPPTERIHGRPGAPSSHRWYLVPRDQCGRTERFQDPTVAEDDGRKSLIELRATGGQTIVPPSQHPTGENLLWEKAGTPAIVEWRTLSRSVRTVAAAALMSRFWQTGARHDIALALTGGLLRCNWSVEDTTHFIACVAHCAGDEEATDRVRVVIDTVRTLENNEPATGFPKLRELIEPRAVDKIVEWLELRVNPTCAIEDREVTHCDGLLPIEVSGRHLRHLSQHALELLRARNDPPSVFVYGGTLAKIEPDESGRPRIIPLDAQGLRCILARSANWVRPTEKGRIIPVAPPINVMEDILRIGSWPEFPPLVGIVTSPVVGTSGILQTAPGYHIDSRLYYFAREQFDLPDITPTSENLREAFYWLDCLLGDFPFVDNASKAHAIALLLLPFVRPVIDGPTPFHLIDAPTPGTGKSLLAERITAVFVPGGATVMVDGNNEDEWRKRITSTLMNTPSHILLDNIKRRLSSGVFAGVLTAETWEDRILGVSRNVALPVRCAWIGTGNNVQLDGEVVRRTVWIRLDAFMERPSERQGFRIADLRSWTSQHRCELVWACLTLINAWLCVGKPKYTGKVFGSYEQWTQVMGGILQSVGIPGFLENRDALYNQSDPEHDMWSAFLEEWYTRHGSEAVGVSQVIDLAAGNGSPMQPGHLSDLLGYGDQRSQRTKLGGYLQRERDRIYGRYQLKWSGTKQGAARYMVLPLVTAPEPRG